MNTQIHEHKTEAKCKAMTKQTKNVQTKWAEIRINEGVKLIQ